MALPSAEEDSDNLEEYEHIFKYRRFLDANNREEYWKSITLKPVEQNPNISSPGALSIGAVRDFHLNPLREANNKNVFF